MNSPTSATPATAACPGIPPSTKNPWAVVGAVFGRACEKPFGIAWGLPVFAGAAGEAMRACATCSDRKRERTMAFIASLAGRLPGFPRKRNLPPKLHYLIDPVDQVTC